MVIKGDGAVARVRRQPPIGSVPTVGVEQDDARAPALTADEQPVGGVQRHLRELAHGHVRSPDAAEPNPFRADGVSDFGKPISLHSQQCGEEINSRGSGHLGWRLDANRRQRRARRDEDPSDTVGDGVKLIARSSCSLDDPQPP
jgi:hypothetical protein